jgi:hypothetical protein
VGEERVVDFVKVEGVSLGVDHDDVFLDDPGRGDEATGVFPEFYAPPRVFPGQFVFYLRLISEEFDTKSLS